MKRDMDLVRAILLEVEKSPSLDGVRIEMPGPSREEVYYNAHLAQEAGLIDAKFLPNSTEFHVLRLTYAGHEFLDAARSDSVWSEAKRLLLKVTGTVTLEGLKAVMPEVIKKLLAG
jgi:hypothetical protein